jgi:hypothetical protein
MAGDPFLNIASRNLATSSWHLTDRFKNIPSTNVFDLPDEIPSIFTLNNFKLRKQSSLTFNKLGYKERT